MNDPDLTQDLLTAVAETILRYFQGSGRWRPWQYEEDHQYGDALMGLHCGQSVYIYDVDECDIQELTVVHVSEENGAAWIILPGTDEVTGFAGPKLYLVTKQGYYPSKAEALLAYEKDIRDDYLEATTNMASLTPLIQQLDQIKHKSYLPEELDR